MEGGGLGVRQQGPAVFSDDQEAFFLLFFFPSAKGVFVLVSYFGWQLNSNSSSLFSYYYLTFCLNQEKLNEVEKTATETHPASADKQQPACRR